MKRSKKNKSHFTYVIVKEIPISLEPGIIYIEGEKSHFWVAAFICPCGCKQPIYLNLLKEASPHWKIKFHFWNKITICPSVNRTVGCKSHFIIRKNKVLWGEW